VVGTQEVARAASVGQRLIMIAKGYAANVGTEIRRYTEIYAEAIRATNIRVE
jgi:hypothetical protein